MTAPSYIDWPSIRGDYIEGLSQGTTRRWPTYEELAAKYGCHAVSIRRVGAKEGWRDERATFRRRVETERREQRTHELATLAADLDVNALRIARSGLSITAARLSELGRQAQERAEAIQGGHPSITAPVDSDELRTLALSARDWYDLGVKALGAETPQRLVIEGDEDHPVQVDVRTRDTRTVRILSILSEVGVLPGGLDHVLGVTGSEASGAGEGSHAPEQSVYPADAHDRGEPEREATRLPSAG